MRTLSERLQTEYGVDIATINDLEEILTLQKIAYQENAIRYNDFTIPPLTQTLEDLTKKFIQNTDYVNNIFNNDTLINFN